MSGGGSVVLAACRSRPAADCGRTASRLHSVHVATTRGELPTASGRSSAFQILLIFLRLGCTSFGGPVAHLGYFRDEFVKRRGWFTEDEYAELVALCQFLPGPASSQVGMAIGLKRAGYAGLLAAWIGFTLPSALIMVAFALGVSVIGVGPDAGWLIGVKAAAVAVVAQAVWGMSKSLVTDRVRAGIAVAAFACVLLIPNPFVQVGAIVVAGAVGVALLRDAAPAAGAVPTSASPASSAADSRSRVPVAVTYLVAFAMLLIGMPILARSVAGPDVALADAAYRAGALVFGGGHVVLPLLEQGVVPSGLVGRDAFIAGYGAAQAVPGPLFTFATYLGAVGGSSWWIGALIATVAIFLPGALLLIGVMPFWEQVRGNALTRRALAGANAAVVGILGAALYNPVFTAGVTGPATLVLVVVAFVALQSWKVPAWAVVLLAALAGCVLPL